MRRVVLVAVVFTSLKCIAGEPLRGYRGFLEWENTAGEIWDYPSGGPDYSKEGVWLCGVATSHGYQFNRHVYVGGGISLMFPMTWTGFSLPVYANFRYDTKFGKATPYGDVRAGYDIAVNSAYFSPTIGYRISVGKKSNFNVGLGVVIRGAQEREVAKTDLCYSLRMGIDF